MDTPDQLSKLIQDIVSRITGQSSGGSKTDDGKQGSKGFSITPQQALIILGIIGDVLKVDSVLVDRNQSVEIVLVGSLKRETQLEKMAGQMGSMPLDEVLKAFLGRLT